MTLEKNGVDYRKGAYFRFDQDEGLPSLLKTVRGRALILTAAINVLWWAVAYEVLEDYAYHRLELVLYSAACLFPTIFILFFSFLFGHLRLHGFWALGSFFIGTSILLGNPDEEMQAALLSWPVVTLLFSFIIYRWGLPARFPLTPDSILKPSEASPSVLIEETRHTLLQDTLRLARAILFLVLPFAILTAGLLSVHALAYFFDQNGIIWLAYLLSILLAALTVYFFIRIFEVLKSTFTGRPISRWIFAAILPASLWFGLASNTIGQLFDNELNPYDVGETVFHLLLTVILAHGFHSILLRGERVSLRRKAQ